MSVEGTVQISIKDFDELRTKAKWFEQIRSELKSCSAVEVEEINDDEFIQVISVDAKKITKLAADYSDVEEVFEDDIIKLVNIEAKYVILHDNMLDQEERTIFYADIPYKIEDYCIENEDGLKTLLEEIWVKYHIENQAVVDERTLK